MTTDKHDSNKDSSEPRGNTWAARDVKDIAAIAIPVDEFYVAEWKERPKSKPSEVHIVLTVGKESEEASVAIALRLKSKRATSELIAALRKHRDLVWP